MASPPRSSGATSPNYPQHVPLPNNPRKRPSLHLASGYNPSKRRKQGSIASGASSAHPLRQTSFPPGEPGADDSALRSPSVETDITAFSGAPSVITGGSGKGRKRKGKRGKRDISGSIAGKTRAGGEKSATGDVEEEDDDDDDGGEGIFNEAGNNVEVEKKRENFDMLYVAFTEDQRDRYEVFNRLHLNHATVRKVYLALLLRN